MVACDRVVGGRGVLYCSRACVVANKVLHYEPPPGRPYDVQDVVDRLIDAHWPSKGRRRAPDTVRLGSMGMGNRRMRRWDE